MSDDNGLTEVVMKDGRRFFCTTEELHEILQEESPPKFVGSPEDLVFPDAPETAYRMAWCDGCAALIPWGHHYCIREESWDYNDLGPWPANEGNEGEDA